MLILKSDRYRVVGYKPEIGLWEFERVASRDEPNHREFLRTSDAKFVEKATDTVTMFRQDGSTVITSIAGVKQDALLQC